jgi:hypothetical protein
VDAPWLEQRVERPEGFGIVVHAKVTLVGRQGKATLLRATFEREDGTPLKDRDGLNANRAGEVVVERRVTPSQATATFDDLDLFLPYVDLHVVEDQPVGEVRHALAYRLHVVADETGETLAQTARQPFEVTATQPAEGWAQIRRVWVSDGGEPAGEERSVLVHVHMRVVRRMGKRTLINVFFTWPDGSSLKDFDGKFATPRGFVATGDFVTPLFEDALWEDYVVRIPFSQLHLEPGKSFDVDAVVQVIVPGTNEVLVESRPAAFHAVSR